MVVEDIPKLLSTPQLISKLKSLIMRNQLVDGGHGRQRHRLKTAHRNGDAGPNDQHDGHHHCRRDDHVPVARALDVLAGLAQHLADDNRTVEPRSDFTVPAGNRDFQLLAGHAHVVHDGLGQLGITGQGPMVVPVRADQVGELTRHITRFSLAALRGLSGDRCAACGARLRFVV